MNANAYISLSGNTVPNTVSPDYTPTPASSNIIGLLYQQVREEVYADYQKVLNAKDAQIKQLEAEIARLKNLKADTVTTTSTHADFSYNSSLFPKHNGNQIIECVIELTSCKREKGKYIISSKTDWYMVWKVLHYFKVYSGSEFDFIDIINDCVLPNIYDDKRKDILSIQVNNFKKIQSDNPMKQHPVHKWRSCLEKQREQEKTKMHGAFVLDRGINIKLKLQDLLQGKGIRIENGET